MTHPTSDELMRYALQGNGSARDLTTHLKRCVACSAEVARLQTGAALLRAHATVEEASSPDCLDDDGIAALAAGDVAADERMPLVTHLASCASCRGRVASVARALASDNVARELAAASTTDRRRRIAQRAMLPIGVAAAAALLFAVLPQTVRRDDSQHRSSAITAAAAPILMAPVGVVADVDNLQWARVPDADRYRVTLFDDGAAVRYESQLADTIVVLPDSVTLIPGRRYFWKVEARTGWDRWATSPLSEFSIALGDRR